MTAGGDLVARVRAWSWRRQRLDRPPGSALETLEHVIAVYAAQPTALLSLAARAEGLRADDVAGLEHDRVAVRIPAMRGSAFLVPTVTAARVVAATRSPRRQFAWLLRELGLDDRAYERLGARIVGAAGEPRKAADLVRGVPGMPTHPQAATLLVRALRTEGLLVAVAPPGPRSNAFRYVATEAWLGRPFDAHDRADALAWLASAYLRAFGPVRVADFRWWSGCRAPEAATAFAAAGPTVDVGDGLLLPAADEPAFAAAASLDGGELSILPLWDAWTMGYAPDGRDRFVDPGDRARLYAGGDALGAVLLGGRARAAWGLRMARDTLQVDLDAFGRLPARRVGEAFDTIGGLLGARDVRIIEAAPRTRRRPPPRPVAAGRQPPDRHPASGRLRRHGEDREE